MITIIILERFGTLIENNINAKDFIKNINKKIENKGTGEIKEIACWTIEDDNKIKLFGWTKGNNSIENKHELPPPHDDNIYYGDICCCKFNKNGKIQNININEYEKFYNQKYGGFDISSDFSSDESCISVFSELAKEEYTDSD